MAFAPMTLASPPSPACLCPRISNSFAAYLAVLVSTVSPLPNGLPHTPGDGPPEKGRCVRIRLRSGGYRSHPSRGTRRTPYTCLSGLGRGHRHVSALAPPLRRQPAPLVSAPPSNKNSQMAPYTPSSTSAEPPSTMSKIGPLWNSKPDASCGVSDPSDATYSVCTSSFSLTISASNKSAR